MEENGKIGLLVAGVEEKKLKKNGSLKGTEKKRILESAIV